MKVRENQIKALKQDNLRFKNQAMKYYKKLRELEDKKSNPDYFEDEVNRVDHRLEVFLQKHGFDPDKDIDEYDSVEAKTYYNKDKRAYEKKAIQEINELKATVEAQRKTIDAFYDQQLDKEDAQARQKNIDFMMQQSRIE